MQQFTHRKVANHRSILIPEFGLRNPPFTFCGWRDSFFEEMLRLNFGQHVRPAASKLFADSNKLKSECRFPWAPHSRVPPFACSPVGCASCCSIVICGVCVLWTVDWVASIMSRRGRVKTLPRRSVAPFCLFRQVGIWRSRAGSVSQRAFAPDGREKHLDFALYGRRSAAE